MTDGFKGIGGVNLIFGLLMNKLRDILLKPFILIFSLKPIYLAKVVRLILVKS